MVVGKALQAEELKGGNFDGLKVDQGVNIFCQVHPPIMVPGDT